MTLMLVSQNNAPATQSAPARRYRIALGRAAKCALFAGFLGQVLACLFVFSVSAFAQEIFPMNLELPLMALKICPTLEEAKAQAKASWEIGKGAFDRQKELDAKSPRCIFTRIVVTPMRIEESISSFDAWADTYAKDGEDVSIIYGKRKVSFKVALKLQHIKYYYVSFKLPDGKLYYGWAEIPDRPPALDYLKEQGIYP